MTLEPCAHHGRQPPCTDAILEARIARVVIASDDPSEKASGRGPGILRDEGVEVELADGPEAAAARLLNQPFRKHARTARPLVVLKSALSLDGRVATAGGDSKWISGRGQPRPRPPLARGVATPSASGSAPRSPTTRCSRPRDPRARSASPTRVVFDSEARLPLGSKLVGSIDAAPLVVIAGPAAPAERTEALKAAGAEVVVCDGDPRGAGGGGARGARAPRGHQRAARGRPDPRRRLPRRRRDRRAAAVHRPDRDRGRRGAARWPGAAGAATIADATPALAMEWERSDGDLLVRARLREW